MVMFGKDVKTIGTTPMKVPQIMAVLVIVAAQLNVLFAEVRRRQSRRDFVRLHVQ